MRGCVAILDFRLIPKTVPTLRHYLFCNYINDLRAKHGSDKAPDFRQRGQLTNAKKSVIRQAFRMSGAATE